MEAFEIGDLILRQKSLGTSYFEFLRSDSMSLGIYQLPAGGSDPQQPHAEDEAYYVVRGRAQVRVGNEERPVEPGSLVFVERRVPHKFFAITEDLTLLVFFAPPHDPAKNG